MKDLLSELQEKCMQGYVLEIFGRYCCREFWIRIISSAIACYSCTSPHPSRRPTLCLSRFPRWCVAVGAFLYVAGYAYNYECMHLSKCIPKRSYASACFLPLTCLLSAAESTSSAPPRSRGNHLATLAQLPVLQKSWQPAPMGMT